jgi:hypothetical protein
MVTTVTALPLIGDVVAGRDVAGRELRISGHPESDRVVLSIWQDGRCRATVRLARADVPEVTRALVATLASPVPAPSPLAAAGPGSVHRLRPPARTGDLRDAVRDLGDRLTTFLPSGLRERLGRSGPGRPD